MSRFKIFLWGVVFVFILLFFLHNQEFFMAKNAFDINVFGIPSLAEYSGFFSNYNTPPMPNVVIFIGFFLLGVLVTYFFNLFGWVRSKRAIKRLSGDCESMTQKIQELELELEAVRNEHGETVGDAEIVNEAEMAARENQAADQALKK